MEGLIDSHSKGENSAETNQLMEDIVAAKGQRSPEILAKVDQLADLRGIDRAQFRAQYDRYLELYQTAKNNGYEAAIDTNRHGEFLGSTVSLRYGKVAGDVLGVDPVFGALLNPTGGLVGPGDDAYQPAPDDAIGYHGAVHDAAGYLYNAHKTGPGYDYLGRDVISTSSPLSGQVGGISWWMSHSQLQADVLPNIMPDIPFVPRFVEHAVSERIEGGIVSSVRVVSSVVEGGGTMVDGVRDVFGGDLSGGAGRVADGAGTIVKGIGRSIIDVFD